MWSSCMMKLNEESTEHIKDRSLSGSGQDLESNLNDVITPNPGDSGHTSTFDIIY